MKRGMPTFREMAQACSGVLWGGESAGGRRPSGIGTDTRTLRPGELFVALKGERHDGHRFLRKALEKGASGLLVSSLPPRLRDELGPGGPAVILVDDTLVALQDLALMMRCRSRCTAIGITGSCGKTTTKDLLASILGVRHRVVASQGSFNNEVGVPLTLLRLRPETDFAVLEMGSRAPGHIRDLARLALPDVGVITMIGRAHLQTFGDLRKVMRSKSELLQALPEGGTAVLNADDPFFEDMRRMSPCRVLAFGTGRRAEVRGSGISTAEGGGVSFTLEIRGGGKRRIDLNLPGRHNAYNALAAAAAALAAGADLEEIEGGLMNAVATEWRMEMIRKAREITIINDAYNANPESMRAALEAMNEIAARSRAIAVLGDMAELGSQSEQAHREVGSMAVDYGTDVLITVGRKARLIARTARERGLPKGSVFTAGDVDEAAAILRAILEPGDVVLIKGSRFMGMERLVEMVA